MCDVISLQKSLNLFDIFFLAPLGLGLIYSMPPWFCTLSTVLLHRSLFFFYQCYSYLCFFYHYNRSVTGSFVTLDLSFLQAGGHASRITPPHVNVRWSNQNQHPPRQTNGRNTSRVPLQKKLLHSVGGRISQQPANWQQLDNWHDWIKIYLLEPFNEERFWPWIWLRTGSKAILCLKGFTIELLLLVPCSWLRIYLLLHVSVKSDWLATRIFLFLARIETTVLKPSFAYKEQKTQNLPSVSFLPAAPPPPPPSTSKSAWH